MSELVVENELKIENSLKEKISDFQEKFLESDIGKAVNSAIDIGLKAVLPDLIEDQIIDIKNAILENGFKEGIKEIINSGINTGKSAIGIVTGEFENISQIQLAVKNGGIIDKFSELLDYVIELAEKKEIINNNISNLIKNGKNTIMESISNKIEDTLTNQLKSIEKIEKYCENWNLAYSIQDISGMEKAYNNIKNNLEKVIPLENTLNKARVIENLQNLIKSKNYDFNLTESELRLAEKL